MLIKYFIKYYNPTTNQSGGIVITESNCEYYFLLAADNELNKMELEEVNTFLQKNKTYQTLYQSILDTKLLQQPTNLAKANLYKTTNVDATNYTEYYLLQLDNELTPDEANALANFLHNNPILAVTLTTLNQTKLVANQSTFANKTKLQKTNHLLFNQQHNIAEILTLYIDGETNPEQNIEIATMLLHNQGWQTELALLQQTKLLTSTILYNNKKSLYKHTVTKVVPLVQKWLQYSVAACLVVLLGYIILGLNAYMGNTVTTHNIAKLTVNERTNNAINNLQYVQQNTAKAFTHTTTEIKNNNLANAKILLKQKLIVTNNNNKRTISNNVANITDLTLNNNIATNNTANNTADNNSIEPVSNSTVSVEKIDLPTARPIIAVTTANNGYKQDTANSTIVDNDITILNIAAAKFDKKEKIKKLRSRIGNYLQTKLTTLQNESIAVGRYEIAMAR